MWAADAIWIVRKRRLRRFTTRTRTSAGIEKHDKSVDKPSHRTLQDGLILIDWKALCTIPVTGTYVAQTLSRLKSNKFPLWNRSAGNLPCPHPACSTLTPSTALHILWDCPGAQVWWQYLLRMWKRIGFDIGEDPLVWIFGLELPDVPATTWPLVQHRLSDHINEGDIREHIFPAAAALWQFQVATTMHGIWGERLRRMEADSTKEGVNSIVAQTTIIRSLHRLRNDGSHGRTGPRDDHALSVLRAYVSIFTEDTRVPRFLPSDSNHQDRTEYLLSFDGGSRGNPGPGGAGAVIVHLNQNHHAASVTWAASMAYASKATTSNVAEYRGLLIGLRHAHNHALKPLHVIGDSAMVITQQCIHKSPTNPRLAALYQATKALADVLGVQSWSHHYREYNKMADCAANVAMDTHHSQQVKVPSTRPLIEQVAQHLHSDVEHWATQTQDQFEQRNPTTRQPRSSPKEQAIALRGFRRRLAIMTPPVP